MNNHLGCSFEIHHRNHGLVYTWMLFDCVWCWFWFQPSVLYQIPSCFIWQRTLWGKILYILFFNVISKSMFNQKDWINWHMFQVNITPDYFQSNDFEDPGVLELKSTWLAFVIISGILFGIALLIFVALRQRIQLAIGLIKEGAKASGQICSSMFFPLVPFILHILVFAWFLTGEHLKKVLIYNWIIFLLKVYFNPGIFITVALCLNSAGEKIYKIHYDYELPASTMMTNQFNESVPLPPNEGCENQQGKQYLLNDNCIPKVFLFW